MNSGSTQELVLGSLCNECNVIHVLLPIYGCYGDFMKERLSKVSASIDQRRVLPLLLYYCLVVLKL